ncbi:MAG: hypothetical protein JRN42_08100, partial [Nitrososphaerota archaeon]|nr:hypothetical protein [Nitrososphaerota archaeon]
ISDAEAERVMTQTKEGAEHPRPAVLFEVGENVRVADGPFTSFNGTVEEVEVGEGGHVYVTFDQSGGRHMLAAYEPTGDLRRSAKLLKRGDTIRAFGGVRRATSRHPKILNMEKLEVKRTRVGGLEAGVYIPSPRANRHLTKPLIRYGLEVYEEAESVEGWLEPSTQLRVHA